MTTLKLLKPNNQEQLSSIEAIRLLQRCRLGRLNVLRWLGEIEPNQLHAVERVYLSHWLCRFETRVERGSTGSRSSEIHALVNGLTLATAWLVERPLIEWVESESLVSLPTNSMSFAGATLADLPVVCHGATVNLGTVPSKLWLRPKLI